MLLVDESKIFYVLKSFLNSILSLILSAPITASDEIRKCILSYIFKYNINCAFCVSECASYLCGFRKNTVSVWRQLLNYLIIFSLLIIWNTWIFWIIFVYFDISLTCGKDGILARATFRLGNFSQGPEFLSGTLLAYPKEFFKTQILS